MGVSHCFPYIQDEAAVLNRYVCVKLFCALFVQVDSRKTERQLFREAAPAALKAEVKSCTQSVRGKRLTLALLPTWCPVWPRG